MNKNRLEAFSDGMFAIIMTIMILDLKAPHGGTFKDLLTVLPEFLCYLQSFLFVGVYWNNHHHLMHTAKKVNGNVMLANMNILFWLSIVPFVTAWVAETNFAQEAVMVYSVALIIPAVSWSLLKVTVEKANNWSPEVKRILTKQSRIKGMISMVIYASGIPFALLNPYISEILFLLVSVMWLMPDKKLEKVLSE